MTELSAVEIAKRQRYLLLLQKVKENKTLSKVELDELSGYERKMVGKIVLDSRIRNLAKPSTKRSTKSSTKRSTKPSAKRGKKKVKKKKTKKKRKIRLPVNEAEVRRMGFEYENLTEADTAIRTRKSLSDILKKHPQLQQAWDRGQFLRNLKALASVVSTASEAAGKLNMPSGEALQDMLDNDSEVSDIWKQTRLNTIIEAREALLAAAREGNHVAIKAVENYLREEKHPGAPGGRADTARMRQVELVDLFGVTKITINDWINKQGMPRNNDKTYNLADVIKWYSGFVRRKEGGKILPADKLRDLKAEEKQLDLAARRHQLLEREEVMAGLVARWQNIIGSFRYKRRELAGLVHSQTVDNIEDILGRFFEDLQREWLTVPEFLYLPEEAGKKLAECMKLCQVE